VFEQGESSQPSDLAAVGQRDSPTEHAEGAGAGWEGLWDAIKKGKQVTECVGFPLGADPPHTRREWTGSRDSRGGGVRGVLHCRLDVRRDGEEGVYAV